MTCHASLLSRLIHGTSHSSYSLLIHEDVTGILISLYTGLVTLSYSLLILYTRLVTRIPISLYTELVTLFCPLLIHEICHAYSYLLIYVTCHAFLLSHYTGLVTLITLRTYGVVITITYFICTRLFTREVHETLLSKNVVFIFRLLMLDFNNN